MTKSLHVVYLILDYPVLWLDLRMTSTTTVKVSRTTITELEKLRQQLRARSLDDAIRSLIKMHRLQALQASLGVDRGKVKPFIEKDRGEDR
jgi:hypothetical protein